MCSDRDSPASRCERSFRAKNQLIARLVTRSTESGTAIPAAMAVALLDDSTCVIALALAVTVAVAVAVTTEISDPTGRTSEPLSIVKPFVRLYTILAEDMSKGLVLDLVPVGQLSELEL